MTADATGQAPTAATDGRSGAELSGPKIRIPRVDLKSVGTERWIAAAAVAGASYVAAWFASFIFVLLTLISLKNVPIDWSWLFLGPAQLVGLALGGTLTASTTAVGVSASASLVWVPLLVTAIVVVGIIVLSRRDEKRHPSVSTSVRWLLSATSGIALALVVTVLAAILRPAFSPASSLGAGVAFRVDASAVSVSGFFGALVVGTLASYLARRVQRSEAIATVAGFRAALGTVVPVAVVYIAVVAALVAVVVIVNTVVQGAPSILLSAPLWLPTAMADGLAMINFSVLSLSGEIAALPGLGQYSTVSLAGSLPWWGTAIVIVVNLALVVALSVVLRLRRSHATRAMSPINWAATVGVFAVMGLAVSLLGSIAAWSHLDTSGLVGAGGSASPLAAMVSGAMSGLASTSATFGPAAWTLVMFALLGALVEASAIWLAPVIIAAVPQPVLSRAGRVFGRFGVGTVPLEGADSVAGGAPMDAAKRKKLITIVSIAGGAAALVIVAAVTVSVLNSQVFSPGARVQEYLESVEHNDATGALAIGDVDGSAASKVLLTNEVLQNTKSTITAHEIVGARDSAGTAEVTVRIHQGSTTSSTSFFLHRSGKKWLFFDVWKMDPVLLPTITVDLTSRLPSMVINGATVDLSKFNASDGFVTLTAFPGTYVATLPSSAKWVTAAAERATVAMGSDSTLRLTPKPSKALVTEVGVEVTALLTECAKSTGLTPEGCPFSAYAYGDTTGASWKLTSAPTFSLRPQVDGGWYVETKDYGTATASYTSSFFGSTSAESYDDSFRVDGTVILEDDKPVFTLDK